MTDTILAGLEKWLTSRQWCREGGQYIPGLHRWIKDRKWEITPEQNDAPIVDDYDPEAQAKRVVERMKAGRL
jgi:hypothetical protein